MGTPEQTDAEVMGLERETTMGSDEDKRGNAVAHAVWRWLQGAKCVELVPWVSSPRSPYHDSQKIAEQDARNRLIEELERVILEASEGVDDAG